jgi:hypothetical protein
MWRPPTFFLLQINQDLNDALLRASAEHAAQAVLTAPPTLVDDADEDPLTASVTTGVSENHFTMSLAVENRMAGWQGRDLHPNQADGPMTSSCHD